MATSTEIGAQLDKQQADYLRRLENAGQLPTVVNQAIEAAGGAETTKLRTDEGKMLTDYVSAGARAREKYKDVFDPFARDRLAANQTAQEYAPISQIRQELAMRAEALGVAQNAAVGLYNAENRKAETALGFTKDTYSRALQAEEIAYKKEQDRIALAESRANRAASSSSKAAKAKEITPAMVSAAIEVLQATPSDNPSDVAYKDGKAVGSRDKVMSQSEAIRALDQLIGMYGDEEMGYQAFKRGFQAGGFTKYGTWDL